MQHDVRKPARPGVNSAVRATASAIVPNDSKAPKRHTAFLKRRWKLLTTIVVVLVISALGYGYITTRNELTRLSNPGATAEADAKKLASEVGRFLELPQDETPTVATVSDAALLKDQVFFSRAENGDRVLVYSKAQRAVLYRPTTKRVIEYAPVSLNQ